MKTSKKTSDTPLLKKALYKSVRLSKCHLSPQQLSTRQSGSRDNYMKPDRNHMKTDRNLNHNKEKDKYTVYTQGLTRPVLLTKPTCRH